MDEVTLAEVAARYAETVKDSSRPSVVAELTRFVNWYGDRPLAKMTGHDVALYAESLGPATPETAKRAEYVRSFLVHLKKAGLLPVNLAPHMRLRKSAKAAAAAPPPAATVVELTQEGVEALQAELEALKEQRMMVREEIRKAMLDKDFRENAPLDAAKDKQGHIEARIREIEAMLRHAVVVHGSGHGGKVKVGTTVTVRSLDTGAVRRFAIVGPSEANAADGKISSASPVGKALLDSRVGDEVEVSAPAGVMRFRVEAIDE